MPDDYGAEIPKLEAKYANYFRIGYTQFELIIDMAQTANGDAIPHTRIIVLPVYAAQLVDVLGRALDEYQQQFGPVPPLT